MSPTTAHESDPILDVIPTCVFRLDRELRHTYVNGQFLRELGLALPEVIGSTVGSLGLPAPLADDLEARARETIETGIPHASEFRVEHPVKGWRVKQLRLIPTEGGGGLTGTVWDVSDRALAEEALRESQSRLRALFDSTFQFVGLLTPDGIVLDANHTALAFAGLGLADVVGKPFWDTPWWTHDPAQQLQLRAAIASAARGEFVRFETTHCDANGRTCTIDFSLKPLCDPDGTAQFLVPEGRDITDRKQAEAALRDSEERYRQIVEDQTEVVSRFSFDGTFTFVNDVFCRVFGKPAHELLGQKWQPIAHPDDVPMIQARLAEMSPANPVVVIENRVTDGSGNVRWMEFVNRGIYGSGGELLQLQSVGRDITARVQAEEARRRAERAMFQMQKLESLGVLAGGIANDFNNLLTGVLGFTSLARAQVQASHPVRAYLDRIDESARRAAGLCEQMLIYSGREPVTVRLVDVNTVISDMSRLLDAAVSRRVSIQFDLAHNLPLFQANPDQIQQVILNLMTNASEAIGSGTGKIRLTTSVVHGDAESLAGFEFPLRRQSEQFVSVEIADDGCGMTEDVKARIFDPFFTTKFTGRGLGLAAVLGIVRSLHGAIRVTSEAGAGTSVRILLPAEASRPVKTGSGPGPEPFGRGRLAIVVDDEEAVRSVVRETLEQAGFVVMQASDGQAGVDLFQVHGAETAFIFLDMTMPRLSGGQALRKFRRLRPDVPVVLASGYNDESVTAEFAEMWLSGLLRKPFSPQDLLKIVFESIGP